MIIGTGFIASAFEKSNFDHSDFIIFASGVSNSLAKRNFEGFDREKKLLKENLANNKKLIYFSTTSIFDKSRIDSAYISFKLEIEKYIQENSNNFLIYRLPIVAGFSNNPCTLLNFLHANIKASNLIEIQFNATRYIVDIEDVVKIVLATAKRATNQILNFTLGTKIKILDLVKIFEEGLNKKANIQIINDGDSYNVENKNLMKLIKDLDIYYGENKIREIIYKYYIT